jgi:hypothetical protein
MCSELSNLLYSNVGFPNAGQVVPKDASKKQRLYVICSG